MRRAVGLASVLVCILVAEVSHAQTPYELKTNREIALIGAGAALELAGLYLNHAMPALTPVQIAELSPEDVNPFDRSAIDNWSPTASKVSDHLLAAGYVWPATLFLSGKIRDDALKILSLYAETALWIASPTLVTKAAARRSRPYVYNGDIPLAQKTTEYARRSFYSGHTVSAFGAVVLTAKVFSDTYPKSDYKNFVWGAAFLYAGTVGYLRYAAGKHFPTDIITGAIVGSFVGFIIPEFHKKEKETALEPLADFAISFSLPL